MRTSEPKPHEINKLLVSFNSEVRKRACCRMMRTSEVGTPASCPIAGALLPMIATIHRKAAVPGAFRHAGAVVFALLTAATLNRVCIRRDAGGGSHPVHGTDGGASSGTCPGARGLHRRWHEGFRRARASRSASSPTTSWSTPRDLASAARAARRSTPHTVFQIGSTTKAFLATTIAIAVDRGKLHWDDRVVDLDPDFQMQGPVGHPRVPRLRPSGAAIGAAALRQRRSRQLGFDESWLIRSLRYVEPVSSFRTTFAYTNITHIFSGPHRRQSGGRRRTGTRCFARSCSSRSA